MRLLDQTQAEALEQRWSPNLVDGPASDDEPPASANCWSEPVRGMLDLHEEMKLAIADRLRGWARRVKRDGVTLWFAARHPMVPWYAKALGVFVVAYALSPIDLIPDFIPVLGYVDDVLLLPGLIWLAIRMIPAPVLAECREHADFWMKARGVKSTSRAGALLVVAIWIAATVALWHWVIRPWLDM